MPESPAISKSAAVTTESTYALVAASCAEVGSVTLTILLLAISSSPCSVTLPLLSTVIRSWFSIPSNSRPTKSASPVSITSIVSFDPGVARNVIAPVVLFNVKSSVKRSKIPFKNTSTFCTPGELVWKTVVEPSPTNCRNTNAACAPPVVVDIQAEPVYISKSSAFTLSYQRSPESGLAGADPWYALGLSNSNKPNPFVFRYVPSVPSDSGNLYPPLSTLPLLVYAEKPVVPFILVDKLWSL